MGQFFEELKRRNVFRVAIAYLVAAWLLLQVSDLLVPILELPEWAGKLIFLLLAIGFVPAVILAWAFELTPSGLKRDKDVERSDSAARVSGRRLDFIIIAALALALGGVVWTSYFDAPESPAAGVDKTIAVLPFTNMSADPANGYFSDGLSDTLLHRLAQIRDLTVTARTSSFQFKGQNLDIREIGRQLGVAYVLEGSVQKSADQLRVIAQLIETKTGNHVASMNYDSTLADIFAIQDEIAEEVVKVLRITLLADEATRLRRRETDSIEAYDEYLLGRRLMAEQGRTAAFKIAIEHFQRAQELDPEFVLAYVAQATARMYLADWGGTDIYSGANDVKRIIGHIERLDADHPDLSLFTAWLSWIDGNAREAERLFVEHLDESPNSEFGFYWYSFFLQNQLRFEDSIDILQRGIRLNPLNPELESLIAWAETGIGDFDAARNRYVKIAQQFPTYNAVKNSLAFDYYASFGQVHLGLPWAEIADRGDGGQLRGFLLLRLQDVRIAEEWIGGHPDTGNPSRNRTRALIELHCDRVENAVQIAKESLFRRDQMEDTAVVFARIARLANADDTGSILSDYEQAIPALVNGRRFVDQVFYWSLGFGPRTYAMAATDYAGLLIQSGESDRAADYLDDVETFISKVPRMGWWGYGILDAEIAAIQGKHEAALDALEDAVDAGWMEDWWFNAKYNPNLKSLHDEPRYQALMQRLSEKAARQLALYREDNPQ